MRFEEVEGKLRFWMLEKLLLGENMLLFLMFLPCLIIGLGLKPWLPAEARPRRPRVKTH